MTSILRCKTSRSSNRVNNAPNRIIFSREKTGAAGFEEEKIVKAVPQEGLSETESGGEIIGSIHLEWRRCGKPTCRCAHGHPHGPYYVRRWREGGRQRKELIRAAEVATVLTALEERRRRLVPVRRILASLRAAEL